MAEKPLLSWAMKKVVGKACDTAAKSLTKAGGVGENDRNEVEELLCDSIKLATELAVDGEADAKKISYKVGEHLIKNGINVAKLTHDQQALCIAAITEIVLTAPAAVKEYVSTYRDAMTASEIGTLFEPGVGTAVGAGAALAWHYSSMAEKTTKAMDAAFDVYSQCGPLAFDKVQKERGVDSALYLDYDYANAVCRVPESGGRADTVTTVNTTLL